MTTWQGAFSARPFVVDLTVNIVSQDAVSNTTTLNAVIHIIQTGAYNTYQLDPIASWVSDVGPSHNGNNFAYDFRAYDILLLANWNIVVGHDAAGFASVWEAVNVAGGLLGNAWAGGTVDLPRIPKPPAQITTLFLNSMTSSSAVLNWYAPDAMGAGIDQYWVQVSRNAAFTDLVYNSQGIGGGSLNVSPLTRATQYWFRVAAHNGMGWGVWSAGFAFVTPATVPDQVVGLSSSVTSSSATLAWSAANNGGNAVDAYQVQIDNNADFSSPLFSGEVAGLSKIINGLGRVTQYYFRVRAHNAIGWGPYSATTGFVTSPTVPDAPPQPMVSDVQADRVTIEWWAPNNGGSAITSYLLQLSTISNFSSIAFSHTPSQSGNGIWTPTGLQPGTTYYVRVRANNAVGSSAWSPGNLFQTISGAKVMVASVWRQSRMRVMEGVLWRLVRVSKRISGTWRS